MYTNTRNERRLAVCAALLTLLWLSPLMSQQAQAQEGTDDGAIEDVEVDEAAEEAAETVTEEVDSDAPDGDETDGDEAVEESVIEEIDRNNDDELGKAIGTGVLGTVTLGFGIALLVEGGNSSDLADQAGNDGYYLYEEELRDRARRQRIWGGVTTGVGVALIAASTYYWIVWSKKHRVEQEEASEDDVSFRMFPSFDPEGGGSVMFTGTF